MYLWAKPKALLSWNSFLVFFPTGGKQTTNTDQIHPCWIVFSVKTSVERCYEHFEAESQDAECVGWGSMANSTGCRSPWSEGISLEWGREPRVPAGVPGRGLCRRKSLEAGMCEASDASCIVLQLGCWWVLSVCVWEMEKTVPCNSNVVNQLPFLSFVNFGDNKRNLKGDCLEPQESLLLLATDP